MLVTPAALIPLATLIESAQMYASTSCTSHLGRGRGRVNELLQRRLWLELRTRLAGGTTWQQSSGRGQLRALILGGASPDTSPAPVESLSEARGLSIWLFMRTSKNWMPTVMESHAGRLCKGDQRALSGEPCASGLSSAIMPFSACAASASQCEIILFCSKVVLLQILPTLARPVASSPLHVAMLYTKKASSMLDNKCV